MRNKIHRRRQVKLQTVTAAQHFTQAHLSLGLLSMLIKFIVGCALVATASFANAQSAALEQDIQVIESLRKNGSDFTKQHRVDYFFVMPNESSAKAIATELASAGFAVQQIGVPPKQKTWEVHVQRLQLVQVDDMQATTIAFTKLAKKYGGDYDGWGAPVAK